MDADLERICFGMISSGGESRSLIFEALMEAKQGKIKEARELIKKSHQPSVEAHKLQMEMLTKEARGENIGSSVLLVHAQDILMATVTERDLATFMIDLFEEIWKQKALK